jgi:hypothetical protein
MIRKPTSNAEAATLLRRAIRVGITINLGGVSTIYCVVNRKSSPRTHSKCSLLAPPLTHHYHYQLLVNLIGAEQIVGMLAIKVLTSSGSAAAAATNPLFLAEVLQPLDILVVQGNTNLILSHFVSLASSLWLTNRIEALEAADKK